MKIAIDGNPICADQMTGIGYLQEGICLALTKKYPEYSYVYNYFSLLDGKGKRSRLERMCVNGAKLRSFPLLTTGIYKLIYGFVPIPYRLLFGRADLTHFYNFLIPPGVSGKKVCTIHDLAFVRYPETVAYRTRKMLEWHLEKTVRRADGIIVDSEYTAKELNELYGVSQEKMHLIYPGIDEKIYYPMTAKEARPILEKHSLKHKDYLLYLGTIEPRKNLAALVRGYSDTVKRLASEGKNAPDLIMAGKLGWYYGEILRTVENEGLTEKVRFLGYIGNDDKAALYSGARAFLFPSLYEGFGMPVAEAMACGAPVLAADASSLTEVAGGCALMCDPLSDASIADGVFRLCTDDGLCSELSASGLKNAKRFTWEEAARMTCEVYRELLGK